VGAGILGARFGSGPTVSFSSLMGFHVYYRIVDGLQKRITERLEPGNGV
jgi:hypothetical protein